MIGKRIRMQRLFNRRTGRSFIVPLDHGVSVGPIPGLVDMRETVDQIAEGGADAVLMHKGLVRCGSRDQGKDVGLIVHLSASTGLSPRPNAKVLVASVEDAIRHGADGVSVHVNIGDENEAVMLADFGRVASEAALWGMPLLAMVYARGPRIKDEFAPDVVAHCARVGVELGADVVKVPYTGDVESFSRVVESCCVPVVIAGGPRLDSPEAVLRMVYDSIQAGGSGLSIGRNVFQHKNVTAMVSALRGVVHEGLTVEEAALRLKA